MQQGIWIYMHSYLQVNNSATYRPAAFQALQMGKENEQT